LKIILFGANGQLGESISKVLGKNQEYNLLTPSRSILNLEEYERTYEYINHVNPDVIINAAGANGGIEMNIREGYNLVDKNMRISLNVIKAASKLSISKLITFAPSCGYPGNLETKLIENQYGSEPLEISSELYARAKILELKLMLNIRQKYTFNWQVLILSNVYGALPKSARDDAHVVESLWRKIFDPDVKKIQIWGSGKAIRNFIHKDDVASAVKFILANDINDPVINVASNEDLSIGELFYTMKRELGSEKEFYFDESKPEGVKFKSLNCDLLSNYGWKSTISLAEGLNLMRGIKASGS
jgi:GDP-L-fucose synthase